jgi:hypothetical protein
MTLDELYQIRDTLHDNWDFISSNTDSDETGLQEEMGNRYVEAIDVLDKEIKRIHLINALARVKKKRK